MANPLVSQGTLNRLRGSVFIIDFPELNVTAPYLGEAGIGLTLEGQTTTMIATLTGNATSPEPFQMATITVNLLKTQSLSDLYKTQIETDTLIGDVSVTPDSAALGDYYFTNCAIESVNPLSFNGKDAGYVVTIRGTYNINDSLWEAS